MKNNKMLFFYVCFPVFTLLLLCVVTSKRRMTYLRIALRRTVKRTSQREVYPRQVDLYASEDEEDVFGFADSIVNAEQKEE